jgi:hypothetical protein
LVGDIGEQAEKVDNNRDNQLRRTIALIAGQDCRKGICSVQLVVMQFQTKLVMTI